MLEPNLLNYTYAAATIGNSARIPLADTALQRNRVDIQVLRGFAVLLVVLHHASLLPQLKAGYLGVDVFFVVSGYLITGIIQRGMLAGTFTFGEFYFLRAKRLLPAAYVTFAISALVSPMFLTRPELRDFAWQLLGAVSFTGNIALWLQTGYFEGAAHLKPLLHVWSLSIEEQYYLLLPAALFFIPRRFWSASAITVFASSFLLCLVLQAGKPGATFYLLPTRAWELALGSIGVLALAPSVTGPWPARLFWPAIAAIVAVPFFPTSAAHPGADAVIVCVATLIVILRRHPFLNQNWAAHSLARIGDISYPLYLVHWPLLAFAANASISPVPGRVRVVLVGMALLLAWALSRWIENPARRAAFKIQTRPKLIIWAAVASITLAMSGFIIYQAESFRQDRDYANIRRVNRGFNDSCEYNDKFIFKPECQNSTNPSIIIWGDSYAMHLVDGIVASTKLGVAQATKSTCGPFLGISTFRREDTFYNRSWAEGCLRFNYSVLDQIEQSKSVHTVVLSSIFSQYLAGNTLLINRQAKGHAFSDSREIQGSDDVAVNSLKATIAAVRALGKRVVIISPPPSSSFNVGKCLELKATGRMFFGGDNSACEISENVYRTEKKPVLSLLDRISREVDVSIINLDDYLCHYAKCMTERNGTFFYIDGGHLSHDGSTLLGKEMGLTERITSAAR